MQKMTKQPNFSVLGVFQIGMQVVFLMCCLLFPIGAFAVRGWMGVCFFMAFFSATVWLLIERLRKRMKMQTQSIQTKKKWFWRLTLLLTLPCISIGLGQLFRHEFIPAEWDAPSRFLCSIPIFWAVHRMVICHIETVKNTISTIGYGYKHKVQHISGDMGRHLMQWSFPLAVVAIFMAIRTNPKAWDINRISTSFVDPLTLGSMALTFALVILASTRLFKSESVLLQFSKLLLVAMGVTLSLQTGSRTGWLALPIVLWVLWVVRRQGVQSWFWLILSWLGCCGLAWAFYTSVAVVQHSVDLAIQDIQNYHWIGMNPDTSVGMRISFARMGWFYFSQNPLAGWGDQGFRHLLNAPEITHFSSDFARQFSFEKGFHNEITTNLVRSGIWGGLCALLMLTMPLVFFTKCIRIPLGLLAFCYWVPICVTAMTTEVFNLKLTASFHAFMLAVLMGCLLGLSDWNSNFQFQSDSRTKRFN